MSEIYNGRCCVNLKDVDMSRCRRERFAVVMVFTALSSVALADSWDVIEHVTQVAPSAVPNVIYFAIDQNAGSCVTGPWLVFAGNPTSNNLPESVRVIYAGLQVALVSGISVEVYGTSMGCVASDVHFLNH
jgi:hypothetical protein